MSCVCSCVCVCVCVCERGRECVCAFCLVCLCVVFVCVFRRVLMMGTFHVLCESEGVCVRERENVRAWVCFCLSLCL